MEVLKVRLGLAVAMGIWIVVVANHWNQWVPHSPLPLTTAALSFAGAIGLGAYRMKFLEEKFGVLEIPAIWESELVQAISWDVLAYTTIFSALILGGAIASSVSPQLPLSIVPLVYILSIGIMGILRWLMSMLMLRMIS